MTFYYYPYASKSIKNFIPPGFYTPFVQFKIIKLLMISRIFILTNEGEKCGFHLEAFFPFLENVSIEVL